MLKNKKKGQLEKLHNISSLPTAWLCLFCFDKKSTTTSRTLRPWKSNPEAKNPGLSPNHWNKSFCHWSQPQNQSKHLMPKKWRGSPNHVFPNPDMKGNPNLMLQWENLTNKCDIETGNAIISTWWLRLAFNNVYITRMT